MWILQAVPRSVQVLAIRLLKILRNLTGRFIMNISTEKRGDVLYEHPPFESEKDLVFIEINSYFFAHHNGVNTSSAPPRSVSACP
jgi:hypothetical protein